MPSQLDRSAVPFARGVAPPPAPRPTAPLWFGVAAFTVLMACWAALGFLTFPADPLGMARVQAAGVFIVAAYVLARAMDLGNRR